MPNNASRIKRSSRSSSAASSRRAPSAPRVGGRRVVFRSSSRQKVARRKVPQLQPKRVTKRSTQSFARTGTTVAHHHNHEHAVAQVARSLGGHGVARAPPPYVSNENPGLRYVTAKVVARFFVTLPAGDTLAAGLTPFNPDGPFCISSAHSPAGDTLALARTNPGLFRSYNANPNLPYPISFTDGSGNAIRYGVVKPLGGKNLRTILGVSTGSRVLVQAAMGSLHIMSSTSALGAYACATAGPHEYPSVLGAAGVVTLNGLVNGVPGVPRGEGDYPIIFDPRGIPSAASFNDVFGQLRDEHYQGTDQRHHYIPLDVNQGSRWIDLDTIQGGTELGAAVSMPSFSSCNVRAAMNQGQGIFMCTATDQNLSLTFECSMTYHVVIANADSPYMYMSNVANNTGPPPPSPFGCSGTGATIHEAICQAQLATGSHPLASPQQRQISGIAHQVASSGRVSTNTHSDGSLLPPAIVAPTHPGPSTTDSVLEALGVQSVVAGAIKYAPKIRSALSSASGFLARGASAFASYAPRVLPIAEEAAETGALMLL